MSAALGYPDDNPKTALGIKKPSIHAVPVLAVFLLGKVMAFGAKKYGIFNYREKRITASTYYNAAMRHMMAYWDGEQVDAESGIDHRAHAMACLAIWLDADSLGKLNDDRGAPGALSKFLVENTQASDPVAVGGTLPADAAASPILSREQVLPRSEIQKVIDASIKAIVARNRGNGDALHVPGPAITAAEADRRIHAGRTAPIGVAWGLLGPDRLGDVE